MVRDGDSGGRASPRLKDQAHQPVTPSLSSEIQQLKEMIIDFKNESKEQHTEVVNNQKEFLTKIEKNAEEIQHLKEENAALKDRVELLEENVIRLDQYSRKDVAIMTGLEFNAGENQSVMQNKVIDIVNKLTGKNFSIADFSAIHRNGNKLKSNGRPPSVTLKFLRFNDKDLLFDKNVNRRRVTMFREIKFHHCLCQGLINLQNKIKAHDSVKFVNYMGSNRHFSVCIRNPNSDNDTFLNRIENYSQFLSELRNVT